MEAKACSNMDISQCSIVASSYFIVMNDPATALITLHVALGKCGLDQAAQESVIAIGGMVHIAMFGMLAAADIARICKVMHTQTVDPIMITVMQEQLLQGMRFWVTNRQCLGLPVEAEDFTTVAVFAQTALMTQMIEDEATTDKDQVATMPEKFKNTVSSTSTGRRHSIVQKEELMRVWGIKGLEATERTKRLSHNW
jgi:hypothetical protein